MASAPQDVYRERLTVRSAALASLDVRRQRLGNVRLLVFAAGAAALWFTFRGQISGWFVTIPLAVFIALVWKQSRLEREMEFSRRAIAFFERGLARIENRWQGGGESGERFINPHHPYSTDLDLFGRASVFELLSTARTRAGEARLASWLLAATDTETLRQRHEALEELRPLVDLREQLATLGSDFRTGVNPDQLTAWATGPVHPFEPRLRWASFLLSIAMGVTLLWWFSTAFVGIAATRTAAALGATVGLIALSIRLRVLKIVGGVNEPAHDLELLSQILDLLERQTFASPRMKELGDAIRTASGHPASKRIARLRRLMELIDSRDNVFVRVLGPPLLWTTQLAMALEAWRAENGALIPVWLDAIAEIEALSSLANYAYEHPDDVLPQLADGAPVFEAEALGHPLLTDERTVRNDVHLAPPVQLFVVSGSNMSGKSTLLRAVGVNAVLALAGGPVRARSLRLSILSVGASIRTSDSLEEGQSRFMAEILRIKAILELPRPALFLLDELLHGTNSHDRATGAAGIVRALLARGAIGLATTHDLSLAAVAKELEPAAANVHFEDRLENGRMVFDYKMREGIVTRSNALDLMRAAGLDV